MSSYEDYTTRSRVYDRTRQAVGLEILIGCLAQAPIPLGELVVADVGCGTGNYTAALLPHVGRIEALDANPGMLEVARAKVASAAPADQARVTFHTGSVDALPFPDAAIDAVMINQVLHHLPDDPAEGFPLHRQVFAEFARVLRPGGVVVINTCSQEQLRHGYWYYELIRAASERLRERYMPVDAVSAALSAGGFDYRGRIAPIDAVLQGDSYFDARGPLREEWRDGESTWSLAAPGELEQAIQRVRQLEAAGELDAFMRLQDERRREIGQVTVLFAVRR